MRAKTNSEAMTVTQRLLASHVDEDDPKDSARVTLRVDHVAIGESAGKVFGMLRDDCVSRVLPETCVFYPPRAFDDGAAGRAFGDLDVVALGLGFFVAKRGSGYAAPTHLERFGAPGRVILTDDPRSMALGGIGMFPILGSPEEIAAALRRGVVECARPVPIQVNLSGKLRPFVGALDAALELARRGIRERVEALASGRGEPVALEFLGPGARLLSVGERGTLASAAMLLGAAHATFASDEKTESYLREQRRSKAFRSVGADPGATYADVVPFDLGSVDPLVRAPGGSISSVREVEETPTPLLLLGGGVGTTLRDLLAIAQLLKSKRVAPHVEALLNPPSRQILETLARQESLADLLATGLRLVEPDETHFDRAGEPNSSAWWLSSADLRPRGIGESSFAIASPETVALSALEGRITDPRGFKRPVRVVVPRSLPTEDVMLCRAPETRGPSRGKGRVDVRPRTSGSRLGDADAPVELSVVAWPASEADLERFEMEPTLLVLERWGDLGEGRDPMGELRDLRLLVTPDIPAQDLRTLGARGVVVLRYDEELAREIVASKRLAAAPTAGDSTTVDLTLESGTRRLERVAAPEPQKRRPS